MSLLHCTVTLFSGLVDVEMPLAVTAITAADAGAATAAMRRGDRCGAGPAAKIPEAGRRRCELAAGDPR